MKKIKGIFLAVVFLGTTTGAFAGENGWWGVSDGCGGVFYLKIDQYESVAQMIGVAAQFAHERCK